MKRIELFGVAAAVLVALSALGASAASGALPEFNPSTVNKIVKGEGKASELTTLGGGITIKCTATTWQGEITGARTAKVNLELTGCSALGFTTNSLGDAAGLTLTGLLPAELCYINEAKKEVGLYISGITIHLEIPTLGLLIDQNGALIGEVTPVNTKQTGPFTLSFAKASAGDQKITECGGKKAGFTASKDSKHEINESAAEEMSAEVTFEKAVEIKA